MTTVRLWLLLRRRSAGQSDPAALTSVLAVVAFAVATAAALVVLGGYQAFAARAADGVAVGAYDAGAYQVLAGIASALLLVPLATLGAAAARLAVARRDARLAALRLAGATTGQVTTLTALDAAVQAAVGAAAGGVLYAAVLPAVARLRFQGRMFEIGELWVGPLLVTATAAAVVLIALISAGASLRRVAVTPLGVAARTTPPGLRAVRILGLVGALGATAIVTSVLQNSAGMIVIVVLAGTLALGMAALNLIGPFVLGLFGRLAAARARSVPTLLAGRRIADDPKTAWRSVGGVALATFIAGFTSISALFSGVGTSPEDAIFATDLQTGGILTLGIAAVLAAVSTGVIQAGRVIDQRATYRSLMLAGTPVRTLDAARLRETLIPLAVSLGVASGVMLAFMHLILGAGTLLQPGPALQFLVSVLGAGALVMLGAATTRIVARRVAPAV